MKRQTKTSGWSKEKREAQRQKCLKQKPWRNATGPQSEQGKQISSQNAYKHGGYDKQMTELSNLLTAQSCYLNSLKKNLRDFVSSC